MQIITKNDVILFREVKAEKLVPSVTVFKNNVDARLHLSATCASDTFWETDFLDYLEVSGGEFATCYQCRSSLQGQKFVSMLTDLMRLRKCVTQLKHSERKARLAWDYDDFNIEKLGRALDALRTICVPLLEDTKGSISTSSTLYLLVDPLMERVILAEQSLVSFFKTSLAREKLSKAPTQHTANWDETFNSLLFCHKSSDGVNFTYSNSSGTSLALAESYGKELVPNKFFSFQHP